MTFKKLYNVTPFVLVALALAFIACLNVGHFGNNSLATTIANDYLLPLVFVSGGFACGLITAKHLMNKK